MLGLQQCLWKLNFLVLCQMWYGFLIGVTNLWGESYITHMCWPAPRFPCHSLLFTLLCMFGLPWISQIDITFRSCIWKNFRHNMSKDKPNIQNHKIQQFTQKKKFHVFDKCQAWFSWSSHSFLSLYQIYLSSALLHNTSDNPLFYFSLMFSYVFFNNSSLFMSMSNLN